MGRKSSEHIVFVSHNASLSGAPKILLGLIESFIQLSGWRISVLLIEEGPLASEFRKLGPTYVLYERPAHTIQFSNGLMRFLKKTYYNLKAKWIFFHIKPADVYFLNTITNGHIHKKMLDAESLFITYVHELETSIRSNTDHNSLKTSLEKSDFFFTGSKAVRYLLNEKYKVPLSKMKTVYSSVGKLVQEKTDFKDIIDSFRTKYDLRDDSFVVGISGASEWRKGFDMLVPLIKVHFTKYPDSRSFFVWKGIGSTVDIRSILFDLEKFGLEDRVCFLPHDKEGLSSMSIFDLHLLLSREDPYPVVVLEAASFAVPTVCFDKAGGAPEFVGKDAGVVLEYGNLLLLADIIFDLENNPERLHLLGKNALLKLQNNHHSEDAARELVEAIQILKKKTGILGEKFVPTA